MSSKNFIILVGLMVFVFGVLYLNFSFLNGSFNSISWGFSSRFIFIYMFFSIDLFLILHIHFKDKDEKTNKKNRG